MAVLGIINLCTIGITIIFIYIVMSMNKSVHYQLDDLTSNHKTLQMQKTTNVYDRQYRLLYLRQKFNNRVEDYFLIDMYEELPDDVRMINLKKDYLQILINAIDTVLTNKQEFEQQYMIYDTPEALKYPYYLPMAKYGKYTIDYDKYLKYVDTEELVVRLNEHYPEFTTNDAYFLTIKNETCTQRAHVLLFLEKAIKLYLKEPVRVDQCIYYNICALVPKQKKCKII